MKPLNDLLASARRAHEQDGVPDEAKATPHLADQVLRALRQTPAEGEALSEWLAMGRWAAGAACAFALVAAVAGPDPNPNPVPLVPPSNPLADFAGW